MLGEWTDELGKDNYIKEWFTTGSKSYGYLTNTEKEVVKIKGFYLKLHKLQTLELRKREKNYRKRY
jgi:hypothetical protein